MFLGGVEEVEHKQPEASGRSWRGRAMNRKRSPSIRPGTMGAMNLCRGQKPICLRELGKGYWRANYASAIMVCDECLHQATNNR